ncbi:MAG: bifunctional diaminohydroxyphosphoribosylaminopyrimidine deaminase/5-amino-6-(5-phosphoribosylamino)uracil reductase RibD [Bacteroidales bacterium]|jgi:diaminohydroxyphosphoribosylaminopyrimidine deaminase/5-amino-6-(5-phosphoribosylamino)uracil reductase|nr:bifunctional diaminohydroxyphosphoribosylaminopyrimidine deaminase/5-amino-6-(5-phosphoribosylamino)uracil reductase RibD [Bacteroidales bacterium]
MEWSIISEQDEFYIQRCLSLARAGFGFVSPNPMVGAVLVENGKVIGEGWHRKYGEAHAEVNAISAVTEITRLPFSTLYVNLEPCAHFGKTPPCADLIIASRIKRVVVGCTDSHDKVSGKGINSLREKGIEVVTPVLENACKDFNRRFFTYHEQKRPYIILKWAQTPDGFMGLPFMQSSRSGGYKITNLDIDTLSHKWRSEEDAILIGYRTYIHDHPLLTTRLFPGKSPRRFVIKYPTTGNKSREDTQLTAEGYTILPENLTEALAILHEQKVTSLIVEGGAATLRHFLENNLWDEARILVGAHPLGHGIPAPAIPAAPSKEMKISNNQLYYVRRHV